MQHIHADFFIPAEKLPDALTNLQAHVRVYQTEFVRTRRMVDGILKAEGLPRALFAANRWRAWGDEHGNLIGLSFAGKNYHFDNYVLATLAPFAREGSFVEVEMEDYAYRWFVQDGELLERTGALVAHPLYAIQWFTAACPALPDRLRLPGEAETGGQRARGA